MIIKHVGGRTCAADSAPCRFDFYLSCFHFGYSNIFQYKRFRAVIAKGFHRRHFAVSSLSYTTLPQGMKYIMKRLKYLCANAVKAESA
jgi:hypothetical protein